MDRRIFNAKSVTGLGASAASETNADLIPNPDITYSLGTSSLRWKDIFTFNLYAANVATKAATVNGTLNVTTVTDVNGNVSGGSIFASNLTLSQALSLTNLTIPGNFNVTGTTNLSGPVNITGAATMGNLTVVMTANQTFSIVGDFAVLGQCNLRNISGISIAMTDMSTTTLVASTSQIAQQSADYASFKFRMQGLNGSNLYFQILESAAIMNMPTTHTNIVGSAATLTLQPYANGGISLNLTSPTTGQSQLKVYGGVVNASPVTWQSTNTMPLQIMSGSDLVFNTNSNATATMTIAGASVGIGTTAPATLYKLDVNGDIRCNTIYGAFTTAATISCSNLRVGTITTPTYPGEIGGTLRVGNAGTTASTAGQITLDGAMSNVSILNRPAIYHKASIGLGLHSDYKMDFSVNGQSGYPAVAMTIDTLGNVGMGLSPVGSTPYRLDVAGAVQSTLLNVNGNIVASGSMTSGPVIASTATIGNGTLISAINCGKLVIGPGTTGTNIFTLNYGRTYSDPASIRLMFTVQYDPYTTGNQVLVNATDVNADHCKVSAYSDSGAWGSTVYLHWVIFYCP